MKQIVENYCRITTKAPAVFVFALDVSGSMLEKIWFNDSMRTKSEVVSIMVNRMLSEIVNRSTRDNGCRDYFKIAVLGYGRDRVESLLGNSQSVTFFTSSQIDSLETDLVYYNVPRILADGVRYMSTISQRQWIKPQGEGNTPMLCGLEEAARLVAEALRENTEESVPPIVFNITDGVASDASPAELLVAAERIKSLKNKNGNSILFNIHISSDSATESIVFPSDKKSFESNSYAELLYSMSSIMPERFTKGIVELTQKSASAAPFRAMSYNASVFELFQMLSIGTVSSVFM